jgi:hypothetical protein
MESHRLISILLALFVAAFLTSTITLTIIQRRLLKQFGWRFFRERSMLEIYWMNLSPGEGIIVARYHILFRYSFGRDYLEDARLVLFVV